ncbi:MAG: MYXO-CTERM domain-containing protein [Myxococcota bacterium]|jgi:MYXO-CTERM domain-containing protein
MRTLVLVSVLLPSVALAWDSEPIELEFSNRTDVFEQFEYDSGILPANSPVGVRVYTNSRGGASTSILGVSELWWPEALTHGFMGYEDGGEFSLDTQLSLNVAAVLDLSQIDLGVLEYGIWNETESFDGQIVFDDMLLPDDPDGIAAISSRGRELGPISTTLNLFTGVSLQFNAEAAPVAEATLTGWGLETDDELVTSIDDTVFVDVPTFSQTRHVTVWTGELEASLDVVVTPSAELCISLFGCVQLVSFDIDLPLGSYTSELRMTENYRHPLPRMEELPRAHDFGEVYMNTEITLDVPVENLGDLPVEGTFRIEGSDSFRVFPDVAYALPEDADGVVVTFAPESIGQTSAVLVVETNDPSIVEVRIPLTGEGIQFPQPGVEPDAEPEPGGGGTATVSSCGCQSTAPATGGLAVFGLLGLMGVRRRRAA